VDALGRVVVLGAGITGLTTAWALSKTCGNDVLVLEQGGPIGGLATTFTRDNFSFDFGSHRLHDGYDPEVTALIRDLCGDDLVRRERKGLLYLNHRFLPYPPSAFQVVFAFGHEDAFRFCRDLVRARMRRTRRRNEPESFEDFAIASVGQSLYDRFYKPYALKLYGRSPQLIAKDPAVHRVRKFSLSRAALELCRHLQKRKPEYLYPAKGIGQLSSELHRRFVANGGTFLSVSRVERFRITDDRTISGIDFALTDSTHGTVETRVVISTIPLDVLHRLVVLKSDRNQSPRFDLQWRGLRLLYLTTKDKIPSEHETFYFPGGDVVFGRVSELSRYSPALNQDAERKVLTIEIPCSYGDELWEMSDESLARRCIQQLQQLQILRAPSSGSEEFFSHRLRAVYPVYDLGWQGRFERIYRRLSSLENLYMIGRTALFLHCNIDHCMAMGLKLARHLTDGHNDRNEWEQVRRRFSDYRVRE
jgi:protoporphyrinogen oxidase